MKGDERCQHCEGATGWFQLYKNLPAVNEPYSDEQWARIGTVGRRDALAHYGSREAARLEIPGGMAPSTMVRCLCPRGQRLDPRVPRVDEVLPAEEIARLWPEGRPSAEAVLTDRYAAAGLAPKYWTWSLDSYQKEFGRDVAVKRYLKLASEWLGSAPADRCDIVLVGPNGTGKTGLAVGLALALCQRQEAPVFIDTRMLMKEWQDTFRPEAKLTELAFLARMEKVSVLVLDEVAGPAMSEFVEGSLSLLIGGRQTHQRPTVMTLNLPALEEGESVGDALKEAIPRLLGPALEDRLRERAMIWSLEGRSRRKTRVLPFAGKSLDAPD